MAYMNQEKKAKIAAALKQVMPRGWKYSLSVRHHSTIVCTISEAPISLKTAFGTESNYWGVNPYHFDRQISDDYTRKTIAAILECLNIDNFDKSDIQSDYFNVGHYVDLNFGKWNKPFIDTTEMVNAA